MRRFQAVGGQRERHRSELDIILQTIRGCSGRVRKVQREDAAASIPTLGWPRCDAARGSHNHGSPTSATSINRKPPNGGWRHSVTCSVSVAAETQRAASLPLRQYGCAHTHMRSHEAFMPADLNSHKHSRARFLPPRASTISPPPPGCRKSQVYNSAETSLPIRTQRPDLPSTYNSYVRLPRMQGTPGLDVPGHV